MKLIIEIPEDIYKFVCQLSCEDSYHYDDVVLTSVKNGTVLPKHGRLIDADKLWDAYHDLDYDFYEALDVAPTILEAWKGENNE